MSSSSAAVFEDCHSHFDNFKSEEDLQSVTIDFFKGEKEKGREGDLPEELPTCLPSQHERTNQHRDRASCAAVELKEERT